MTKTVRHSIWVRICHWLAALSMLALMVSGYAMLMTNPNLYWGEVGNPLTPAFLELPVSKNFRHGGWSEPVPFYDGDGSPVSANRGFEILNLNSWGRSLHFLMAWVLVVTGSIYLILGLFSGHFRRKLLPVASELSTQAFWRDIRRHARFQFDAPESGAPYGLLQKFTYSTILFLVMPLIFLTGLTMSPSITAALPMLLDLFGGYQSARTIHFFAFVALALFLLVHVLMVLLSGAGRQLRAMTLGLKSPDIKHD